MKKCNKCNIEKEHSEFNKKSASKDGLQNFCRKCDNAAQKQRYKKDKQYYIDKSKIQRIILRNYVNTLKEEGCMYCAEDDIVCMDFHHVKGNKNDSIASMVNRAVSFKILKEEIAKCIILCANCHRKIHR